MKKITFHDIGELKHKSRCCYHKVRISLPNNKAQIDFVGFTITIRIFPWIYAFSLNLKHIQGGTNFCLYVLSWSPSWAAIPLGLGLVLAFCSIQPAATSYSKNNRIFARTFSHHAHTQTLSGRALITFDFLSHLTPFNWFSAIYIHL